MKTNQKGFTLIELLIVIGLLGALTALILPSLSANREDAIGDVCDYNQAGTVRVLRQYNSMMGQFPSDLHNGLQGVDATASVAMEGLPSAQTDHMVTNIANTRQALTQAQSESLAAAGIVSVCSGTGLNSTALWVDADGDDEVDSGEGVADVAVAFACSATGTNPWNDDGGVEMTFDGIDISDWATATGTPSWDASAGPVVCLWITPTVNWTAGNGGNNDWTKGNVELSLDIEGQCPVPTEAASGEEVSFAYYMAYFKVYSNGNPARMIGTTCPECGVMNP